MPDALKPGESLADQAQIGAFTRGDRPYLGDRDVVHGILKDLVDVVLEEPDEIEGAIGDAVDILVGDDPDYAPMGVWNTGEGLGNWIRGHMNGVPDGDTAEAVRYALGHLVLHWLDSIKTVANQTEQPEAVAAKLERIMGNWTNLMIGIPTQAQEAR